MKEMNSMNDSQIVELYWQRKESAIQETNVKYGAYCYSIANNILSCREDADECVNDTWLRAWKTMPPQKPGRLRLFLAKITRNLSFDKFKARNAEKRGNGEFPLVLDELESCIADIKDTEAEFSAKELGKSINRFLQTLSERECSIFLRRYFYAESVAEISIRYGLKDSNVQVILSRTRKKLREHLEKEGYII